MHVYIEGFTVSPLTSGAAKCPVALKHFPVTAISCVGTIFLEHIENLFSIFNSPFIAGCKGVFTQRINGKTVTVNYLFVDFYIPFPVHHPIETAMFVIPHFVDQKIDAVSGQFSQFTVAVTSPVSRRNRVKTAGLSNQRFFIFAGVVSIYIEMSDVTPVFFVFHPGCPER